jgi:hypothetical protein
MLILTKVFIVMWCVLDTEFCINCLSLVKSDLNGDGFVDKDEVNQVIKEILKSDDSDKANYQRQKYIYDK